MSLFFANFIIALREGLEAALVVGVIAAYLAKIGRRDLFGKLALGVLAAALVPLAIGAILTWGPQTLTFQAQEIIGGSLSLVAVAMVTWMIFWMGKNSRQMSQGLRDSLSASLEKDGRGWGIIWIAIFAVGREGIETALFIWATVRSAVEKSTPAIAAGVVGGLAVAIVLGYLIYRGGVRINLSVFFTVTGYFLIVVAAGIISYGFGDLQEASVLPGWAHHAWDVSNWVPQSSVNPLRWLYEVSVALFQVNPTPSWLQVIGWNIYFWPTLYFFARVAHAKSGKAPKVESKAE